MRRPVVPCRALRASERAALALIVLAVCPACLVDFGSDHLTPSGTCGDGHRDLGEECDDGNRTNGDGCDTLCRRESGWDCVGDSPSSCEPVCGDEIIRGDETCDGWNLGGATCADLGYETGTLLCEADCRDVDVSHCEGFCGDGVAGGTEECDTDDLGEATCADLGYYQGTLGCAEATCRFDTSGCSERCGDGALNGPEACDGPILDGATCLNLGYYGGTLACGADCLDFDIGQCHVVPRIKVNELQIWFINFIELLNSSEVAVNLDGYWLRIDQEDAEGSVTAQDLILPAYSLAPGDRVVLRDVFSGTGSPPQVDGATIRYNVHFALARQPGAVTLYTADDAPTDFVRWGGCAASPPAGTAWTDSPDPLSSVMPMGMTLSYSRVPDGGDSDVAGDFCISEVTEGAENTNPCEILAARGSLLLTEVSVATVNGWELHNPGTAPVSLVGWTLEAYDGAGTLWTTVIPDIVLPASSYLTIAGDLASGAPYLENGVLHVSDPGWTVGSPGAAWIAEPVARQIVDWVQWGQGGVYVANTGDWADTPGPLTPATAGHVLGRRTLLDTDTAADWCAQNESLGDPNGACL